MRCNICNIMMEYMYADLHICRDCNFISSSINPDLQLYDKSYLRKYERYEQSSIGKAIDKFRLSVIKSYHDPYKIILDFGCGSGSFVKVAKKEGLKIIGFDINPYSEFCDISILFNGHSTTTFWDSLEHLKNPKKVIQGLQSELIFISTPSTDGCKSKKLTEWKHYYPGEHVHYFNEESLTKLLTICGYTIVTISYGESACRIGDDKKNILTMGGLHESFGQK